VLILNDINYMQGAENIYGGVGGGVQGIAEIREQRSDVGKALF
jgi:hypothetical protein